MKRHRAVILALALLAALAPRIEAQEFSFTYQSRRGWFGFSYDRAQTKVGSETTLALIVRSVVDDSPAQKAGLQKEDAILRINGLKATEQLLTTLGSSLTPGDTVTFRIRRAGREQELRLVAAAPPPGADRSQLMYDSAQRFVRIFIDSARAGMDTAFFRRLPRGAFDSTFVRRLPPGAFDTTFFRRLPSGDSVRGYMYAWSDSGAAWPDSVRRRILRDRVLRLDSAGRLRPVPHDSVEFFRPGERVFSFGRPGDLPAQEIVVHSWGLGRRAIAGAELQDLNAELARYFRVNAGVLVTNVPENTPARRAGLQAGDVITAVEGTTVTDVEQLRRAIDRASAASVRLDYVRQGERKTLQLRK